MKIVIFSHDLPWPKNHGGRIDMYNRLKALKELNHNVFFVCWALFEDNKSEESVGHIRSLVEVLVCFTRKNNFVSRMADISFKLFKLIVQPNLVTQCSLNGKAFSRLKNQIQNFNADVIFVENIYAAKLAYKYASLMNLPVFIRLHNVEHIYIKELALLSSSIKTKLKFLAMRANLKKYERRMIQRADAFFDISLSDLAYWKLQGLKKGYWMPPVYYADDNKNILIKNNQHSFDIAYIGNLNSPNNIQGLFWFLETILPRIQEQYPSVIILIAGSKPIKKLSDYCLQKSNIVLLPDPKNVHELYLQSRILINPLCFGSGVNIKTIEMLHSGKQVVCTRKAIEGLPIEVELLFDIAENADQFATKILKHLLHDVIFTSPQNQMIKYFAPSYLTSNLEIMEKISMERKKEEN